MRAKIAMKDIDDTLARFGKRGAELVGEVTQYKDKHRLRYIRGPEEILIGLAKSSGKHGL